MGAQVVGFTMSAIAAVDLSASYGCAVDLNASGQAVLPTAGGGIVGILVDKEVAGQAVSFQIAGQAIMLAGGTVTPGDYIKVDSSGRAVTANAADVAAGKAVGRCTEGATIGAYASVLLDIFGAGYVSVAGADTITSGAASLNTETTNLSTTGAVAYTLANGLFVGQRKRFREITAATSPAGTLTLATPFGSESAVHVFHAQFQEIVFEWTVAGWKTISKTRAGTLAVVVGTTVLTGYDLAAVYALSVTATVSSTTTKSIPNGVLNGEFISIRTAVAASSPVGNINLTATTVPGAAATNLAGINATTCTAQMIWDGATWQALVLNTITLA